MTSPAPVALASLNGADLPGFLALLGGVFERSPWVAECAHGHRPFASTEAVHGAMMRCVREAPALRQLALIRAHPELAGREASEGALSADSSGEQERLGFTALSHEDFERMQDINRRYRAKFGFPCIVALALHAGRDSVIEEMERRIGNTHEQERHTALEQIGHITRARLRRLLRDT
jgi:2-oxo-4-hydroxy-4-carboxy-5-ureidoimidazoline decarboxylase